MSNKKRDVKCQFLHKNKYFSASICKSGPKLENTQQGSVLFMDDFKNMAIGPILSKRFACEQ